jgi:hypothetical protein
LPFQRRFSTQALAQFLIQEALVLHKASPHLDYTDSLRKGNAVITLVRGPVQPAEQRHR